jgi:hypothetical protein
MSDWEMEEEYEDDTHARIKSWCKMKLNFGRLGRAFGGCGDDFESQINQQQKIAEEEETIFMLKYLLPNELNNKDKLNNILGTIKKIRGEKIFAKETLEYKRLNILENNTKLFINRTT